MADDESGAKRRKKKERKEGPETGAARTRASSRRARVRRFPVIWWSSAGTTVVCLVLIFLLRTAVSSWDHAVVNVITWALGGLAVGASLFWFGFSTGISRALRIVVVVAILALLLILRLTLRIDQVTGELTPSFAWRWTPKPDQLLDEVAVRPDVEPVDLRSTTPDDFPQFLGPRRDLTARDANLSRDWADRPPKLLWRQPIGAAWSAFSAVNGFAVTMEQRGDKELVVCYELLTGEPRWRRWISARHSTTLGGVGPRCTPTIHDGDVFALGATGVLRCLDGRDGQEIWRHDLLAEIGSDPERELSCVSWGRAASPLIVDQLVIIPLGGPPDGPWASLAAYDAGTGDLQWKGGQRQISYSSPVDAEIAGTRQILIVSEDWVSGHDPANGAVLWEYPWPGKSHADASVSQAVPLPGDRVFLSKGYGGGSAMLQLHRADDGAFQVELRWRNPSVLKTKFANVAVRDSYAYGLSDGVLECVDLDTGKRMWKSGRYGHGQILRTGDLLLVQSETGEVAMVEATPAARRQLGQFRAIQGKSWNNLCLYGRYLLVRNAEEAACYELPVRPAAEAP